MKSSLQKFLMPLMLLTLSVRCNKEWFDEKPNQRLVVPTTINELQAMLDNDGVFFLNHPNLGEASSDNFFWSSSAYNSRTIRDRNIYSWASTEDFYDGPSFSDWGSSYERVLYSNYVLEAINKITPTNQSREAWKNVKGSALFHRAHSFFEIAQYWCKPYSEFTAETDPGIIIRTNSNINAPSVRSTVKQTYKQIITDLTDAKDLLPTTSPSLTYKTRPSKAAVLAMLARVYLSMVNFTEALFAADSCLQIYNSLLDYNSSLVLPAQANPISLSSGNVEIIFHCRFTNYNMLAHNNGVGTVDSNLYNSYHISDRRRDAFFKLISGRRAFVGSYDGGPTFLFGGLATDEVYLIRAECHARQGNVTAAMQDLNTLMQKRWATASWVPFTATDAEDALRKILVERRKELCFRGLRWTDLRRLNTDPRFAITLSHGVIGTTMQWSLPPNDNRYVFPIPDNEIIYSGVEQNPR